MERNVFLCHMNNIYIYIYKNHDLNILMKIIIYNLIVSRFFDAMPRNGIIRYRFAKKEGAWINWEWIALHHAYQEASQKPSGAQRQRDLLLGRQWVATASSWMWRVIGCVKKINSHYLPLTYTNASRSLTIRIAGFSPIVLIIFF